MKASLLTPEQEAEVIQFLEWAEANKANEGIDVQLRDIAKDLGWSQLTLERVIRKVIRKTPELGISVSIKRGRDRQVVVTWDDALMLDPGVVEDVWGMAVGERRENFGRMVRSASTLLTGYANVRPKTRTQAKMLRREQNLVVQFLFNAHSVARRAEEAEMDRLAEEIERVLAVAGINFPDSDDGDLPE